MLLLIIDSFEMMTNKKITIGVLIAVAVILIAWDIYVACCGTDGDTISEVMLFFSKHPIIPCGFGVLMGHFFWPQYRE